MHRHEALDALARRPDLTAATITGIVAAGDGWLLSALARNTALPEDIWLFLARHDDAAVRAGVLRDGAPRAVFEVLVDDPDVAVRARFAQCAAPAALLARLATDPVPDVRATLATWWTRAPEPVRRQLLTDPVDDVRAAACTTYYSRLPHPVPPADLLPALLADAVTRPGAVRHVSLDAATATRLAATRTRTCAERSPRTRTCRRTSSTCSPVIPTGSSACGSSRAPTRLPSCARPSTPDSRPAGRSTGPTRTATVRSSTASRRRN